MLDLEQMNELLAHGFKLDNDLKLAVEENAKIKAMNATGPYIVDAAYRKGLISLVFERNTSVDTDVSGQQVTVNYAPVCVVDGPNGKATCAANDTELILAVAEALA